MQDMDLSTITSVRNDTVWKIYEIPPCTRKKRKTRNTIPIPFRPINFRVDENGTITLSNDRAFKFIYRHLVRGNLYGRQEEVFE